MVLVAGICPLPEALLQVAPSQSRLGCRVVGAALGAQSSAPSTPEKDARTAWGSLSSGSRGL